MKYLLYWSNNEQAFTLLEEGDKQDFLLEDDAKVVHTITAPDFETANKKMDDFINEN